MCFTSSSDVQKITLGSFSSQDFTGLKDPTLRRLFDSVSCDDFKGHIWSHIHTTLFDQSPPPSPAMVQKEIKSYAQNYLLNTGASPKTVRMFAHHFSNIYKLSLEFFADKPIDLIQEELTLIELIGDDEVSSYENAELAEFIKKINLLFQQLKNLTAPLKLECRVIRPQSIEMQTPHTPVIIPADSSEIHPLVYGARKVMATAYQSCKVLDLNYTPLVPDETPDVRGIVETSWHGIGDGIRRNISSVDQVNATHYYLKKLQSYYLNTRNLDILPTSGPSCPNIFKTPLIFDFGGKPYLTSDPSYPQVNLFKNYGSGTSALGVDCSGFVVAALAGAGLRVKRNKPIGNNMVGLSSWMLKDPIGSHLNCLQKITSENYKHPLLPGDIIAAKGHVVIIDRVHNDLFRGRLDPFGLLHTKSPADCSKLTLNNFQFSILQSTSEFNGMGINRIHIRDTVHPELTSGLIQYAVNTCRLKFGRPAKFKNINDITISRHTLDSQCTEEEWYFVGEECIRDCS